MSQKPCTGESCSVRGWCKLFAKSPEAIEPLITGSKCPNFIPTYSSSHEDKK